MSDFAEFISMLSPHKRTLFALRNPLSFDQKRLWFLDQLRPELSAYNLTKAVRFHGTLHLAALARSVNTIVQRHAALRTTFPAVDGQPVQWVSPSLAVPLPLIDLGSLPEAGREPEAQRLIVQTARQPFDLAHGPLLRLRVIRLSQAVHLVVLVNHHIVSDAWSMAVFVQELAALYEGEVRGQPARLPDLPIQYTDYALWQQEWLQGERLETQLAYWKEKLAGAPPTLLMPTDRPRPAVQQFRGQRHHFHLPGGLAASLSALSQAEGATLFMVLLAAFKALLYRYSGQADLVVGTPITNRHQAEIRGLIGFFINTLALRTDLSGDPTFRELLGRVRQTALGAYASQDIPFEKLIEAVQPERDLSHEPLFQVAFVLQNVPIPPVEWPGLTLEPLTVDGEATLFDLSLDVAETGQGLVCFFAYDIDLFDAATIERLARHFQALLADAAAHPDRRLSELSLLDAAERDLLLRGWNNAVQPFADERCLPQRVEDQAARQPGARAAAYCPAPRPDPARPASELTYAALNRRANQLAHYLRSLGVGPEVLVGVFMERSVDMVVGLLGILKAGGAYLPLDPAYPKERLAFMLEDAQPPILLTLGRLLDEIPNYWAPVVSLDEDWGMIELERDENPAPTARLDHLAYVIYTSGSTGQPKGVMISHGGLVNLVTWHQQAYQVSAQDRTTQLAGFGFDASVWEVWPSLASGAALYLPDDETRMSPGRLLDWLAANEITLSFLPTPLAEAALQHSPPKGLKLRALLTGGDRLHGYPQASAWPVEVVNHYGPTEATVVTTWAPLSQVSRRAAPPPIGRPIANTQVYILDKALRPVPVGVSGELYVGGASLARGYVNDPALTAEKFVPDPFGPSPTLPHFHSTKMEEGGADRPPEQSEWGKRRVGAGVRLYRTGDLARWRPDGQIDFLGRVDSQVKIRGYRIELGEIESVLRRHPAVREAAAAVRPAEGSSGPRLIAYWVTAPGAATGADELRAFLRQYLPEYMTPAAFVPMEALPITPNGKVDRQALPAPAPETDRARTAPRTPTEMRIADIWGEVLGVPQLGVYDNFFELGGHSLIGAQIIARLQKAFDVDLSLGRLFEAPTVAGLAESIEAARRAGGEMSTLPLQPAPRAGPLPLSFAQERLWFIDQLAPDNPAYNIPTAVRLTGRLDVGALGRSLNEIVRRHEILRTTFANIDGRPIQVIAPALHLALPVVDLRGCPAGQIEPEARRLAGREVQRPFALNAGPLLRGVLLRLADEEHLAILTMHHIVSDGWSLGLLVREWITLYAAFSAGRPSPLAELPIQYVDFALWQRDWLTGQVREAQLAYWKSQLAGVSALEFPTDYARPLVQTYQGATCALVLPAELTEALKALCLREGATLYMTLLAAFQILLHRCTGQDDITVGSPIAGRNRVETERLIGFFINTLVLRASLAGQPTFREFLQQVREVCSGAYAHQDIPFEHLLEALHPERDLSRTPFFQVLFNMLNLPGTDLTVPGLAIAGLELPEVGSKFDLTLHAVEQGNRLRFDLVYNADLFEPARMVEMLAQYRLLLEQIAGAPDAPIARYSLVTPDARPRLPDPAEVLDDRFVGAVHQLVAQQARRRPAQVAVADTHERWTYQELDARSSQLANALRAHGIGRGEVVAIYAHRSAALVWAVLGIFKAGAAYFILDPAYPPARLVDCLSLARPRGLLHLEAAGPLPAEAEALIAAAPLACRLTIPARAAQAQSLFGHYPADDPALEVGPDDLAYIAFTSGSTGKPKGVLGRHGPLTHFMPWVRETFDLRETDRFSVLAGLPFDLLQREIFTPLCMGATACLPDPAMIGAPGWLAGWLRQEQVSVTHLTPATNLLLTEGAVAELPDLRRAFFIGDTLTRRDVDRLRRLAPAAACVNLYGVTEAQRAVSYFVIGSGTDTGTGWTRDLIPVGRGMPGLQLLVLGRAQQMAGVGEVGEIYFHTPHLALGYLGDETLTRERFIPNPFTPTLPHSDGMGKGRLYKTGDLGRYLPDGNVDSLGRADLQVKIRGFRIELGEIEMALSSHPGVRESAVVAVEFGDGLNAAREKRLVAYLALRGTAEPPSTEDLQHFLKQRLPEYMIPAAFVTLEVLPLTPSRKIDRQALRLRGLPEDWQPGTDAAFVAPRTSLEAELADIWADLLGLKQVSVQANFFQLGGHSLLVTQLISRLRKAFGVELPIRRLFEAPTVAELAVAILQKQSEALDEAELAQLLAEFESSPQPEAPAIPSLEPPVKEGDRSLD